MVKFQGHWKWSENKNQILLEKLCFFLSTLHQLLISTNCGIDFNQANDILLATCCRLLSKLTHIAQIKSNIFFCTNVDRKKTEKPKSQNMWQTLINFNQFVPSIQFSPAIATNDALKSHHQFHFPARPKKKQYFSTHMN